MLTKRMIDIYTWRNIILKVTSHKFQQNTDYYQELALKESITITQNDRVDLVLMNAEEYRQLRKRARIVLGVRELSDEDIKHIETNSMHEKHNHLNSEIDKSN